MSTTQTQAVGTPDTKPTVITMLASVEEAKPVSKPRQPALTPATEMDLERSGLNAEMIGAMGIRCLTERMHLKELLGRDDFEPGETGYRIPYLNRAGKPTPHFNVRLLKGVPRPDDSGKRIKYLKPAGSPNLVYFPPGIDVLLSANDYVIITEGEKKAAKAVQEGFPCVAIGGVWNWMDQAAREIEKQKGKKASYASLPLKDLTDLAASHKVVLLFDSDADQNKSVRQALNTLKDALLFRGVKWVKKLDMPRPSDEGTEAKIGLDDLLLHSQGAELLKLRLAELATLPSDPISPLKHFKYAEDSKGKPLHYIVPNTGGAGQDSNVILKQVEREDSDGFMVRSVVNLATTRIWVERIITDVDTDECRYEMGFVPLAEREPRYLTGGAEMLTFSGSNSIYTDRGALVLSKDKPALEAFWHACQTSGAVKKGKGSSQRGWMEIDGVTGYLTAGGVILQDAQYDGHHPDAPIVPIPVGAADNILAKNMQSQGSVREWATAMATRVLSHPLPSLMCGAGVAGLLRHWCPDSENFIVHLYGQSSGGKTSALKACASIFGHPDKLKETWRTTDNALESKLIARNDGVVFLDECSQQKDEKVLEDAAYLIGNGTQKSRASRDGGERQTRSFRVVALSTGEEVLFKDAKKGGQEVRTLEVAANAGGNLWGQATAHEIETLMRVLGSNHGWGLAPLVALILKREAERAGYWKESMRSILASYRAALPAKAPDIVVRRCKHYALITVGYRLLLDVVGELSGDRDCQKQNQMRMDQFADFVVKNLLVLKTDQFSKSENETMLEAFKEGLVIHAAHIHTGEAGKTYGEVWALMTSKGNLVVLPTMLGKFASKYDKHRLLAALQEAGVVPAKLTSTRFQKGASPLPVWSVDTTKL
jgi:hypothetical protein